MNQLGNTEFPLSGAIYLRAIHALNQRSRDLWQSDLASLRGAMKHLIESQFTAELENFSDEFADRLVEEGGWELSLLPDYLRDDNCSLHVSHDDAKALLENWPDPTRQPDGYPDQKLSDLEALEEVLCQRRKNQDQNYPSEAQCYALIALEKVFTIDALLSKGGGPTKASEAPTEPLLFACAAAIEAMEMICSAERKLAHEKLPADAAEQVRQLESETLIGARRSMAASGAKNRWAKDPKTAAKQQVKQCWDMWHADPKRYRSKKEFAFDMLSKYEKLSNPETIQRWCRDWHADAASSVTILPAGS